MPTLRIIPAGVRAPNIMGDKDYDGAADQVIVLAAQQAEFRKRPAVSTDDDNPTLLVGPDPMRKACLVLVDPINGAAGDYVWVGSDATDTSEYMPIEAGQPFVHEAGSALYGFADINSGASHLDVYTDDEVH